MTTFDGVLIGSILLPLIIVIVPMLFGNTKIDKPKMSIVFLLYALFIISIIFLAFRFGWETDLLNNWFILILIIMIFVSFPILFSLYLYDYDYCKSIPDFEFPTLFSVYAIIITSFVATVAYIIKNIFS